jgi:hypothetical protein
LVPIYIPPPWIFVKEGLVFTPLIFSSGALVYTPFDDDLREAEVYIPLMISYGFIWGSIGLHPIEDFFWGQRYTSLPIEDR